MTSKETRGRDGAARTLARTLGATLVAVLLLAPLPIGASELPPSQGENPTQPVASAGGITIPSKDKQNLAYWPWAEGRRMFSLGDPRNAPNPTSWGSLVVHDLDSFQEVTRITLPNPAPNATLYADAQDHLAAMDAAGGRLFVAGTTPSPYGSNAAGAPVVAAKVVDGQACVGLDRSCFGGVNVVDMTTLEPKGFIPFRSIQIDALVGQPLLRAMTYAPARAEGDADKLYYVIEDHTAVPINFDATPRNWGANLAWLVQTDVATGQQDWAVRLDPCRYGREPSNGSDSSTTRPLQHPAAVLRSADMTSPGVFVACHSSTAQTGMVVLVPLDAEGRPATLPVQLHDPEGTVAESVEAGEPMIDGSYSTDGALQSFSGPDRAFEMIADPVSERILMRVLAGNPQAEVWWVFDTREREYIGTIGIGRYRYVESRNGFDPGTGRLYLLAPPTETFSGGLLISDARRTPLMQPLVFPELANLGKLTNSGLIVEPGDAGRPPRVWYRDVNQLLYVEDRYPLTEEVQPEDHAGRTLDLPEIEGVTSVAYDGAARGYGLRTLLVGGLEAVGRVGPVDVGQVEGVQYSPAWTSTNQMQTIATIAGLPLFNNPCGTSSREIVLGAVGPEEPVVLDMSGARGTAQPVAVDPTLSDDFETPYSRCSPVGDWNDLWSAGLFGRPPVPEPAPEWPLRDSQTSCIAKDDEETEDSWGDPIGSFLSSEVQCAPEEANGWSQARSAEVAGVSVAQATSSFRVYRDPLRGLVARVESVTRGVDLGMGIRIESVRGVAEAWANGRRQPVRPEDREPDYSPICDAERTAGTCFRSRLMGVYTPDYHCGLCEDEQKVVEALNKAIGANGRVRMRQPDPVLATGSENGYIAAVQKPDHERFADLTLNNDLLQTVVPALEVVRYAPASQPVGGTNSRGRQIFQFAGVEVSASYGIQCLLEYDAATNECAPAKLPPGSLTVSLAASDGTPLAGGAFEVREDTDADGVLGLKDELLPEGACVTAADGIGTCAFTALRPGTYLVSQTAAPAGYARLDEASVVELASGQAATLAVVNASNVAVIDVRATDEAGDPLAGATFAAYPDPDADGKVAPDAQPAGTCTTGADGTCRIEVPAGSYVLVQTAAPGGLEGIEPVAFAVTGGQTAAVGVVNYPPDTPDAPPAAGPVTYEPAPPVSQPEVSVEPYLPPVEVDEPVAPEVSLPEAVGGTVVQVIRAPGDALRLLARDPMQAVAWMASVGLFALAAHAVRRRIMAEALTKL